MKGQNESVRRYFRVRPLEGKIPGIDDFSCGDEDLDDWIRNDAQRLQAANVVQTFLGLCDNRAVGFIGLMSDAVELEMRERSKLDLSRRDHPVIPALKIARLGICTSFRGRSAGTAMMRFAYDIALKVSRHSGCRLLTVDAYPESVGFYERLGFVPNRAKRYKGKHTISMRFDIHAPELLEWVGYL